jgi:NADPH-dependent 2,4-dienoyl-CoA reductase/sulfur reductase-like enzyme
MVGVVWPGLLRKIVRMTGRKSEQEHQKCSVVVIGAGFAGLAAARTLKQVFWKGRSETDL